MAIVAGTHTVSKAPQHAVYRCIYRRPIVDSLLEIWQGGHPDYIAPV